MSKTLTIFIYFSILNFITIGVYDQMKRFFLFTLMSLFATTCFLLANPNAYGYDWDFVGGMLFDDVYGSIYLTTDWDEESEIASAYFSFYTSNEGRGDVKMYSTATVQVFWNGGSVSPAPREDSEIVPENRTGSIYEDFTFKLRNKEEGNAHISAVGKLEVRHIPSGDKHGLPREAKRITHFDIL